MAVIGYEGKFGKRGQVVDKTTVIWSCEGCGRIRKSRKGMFSGDTCCTCSRHGSPITVEDTKSLYPCVKEVLTYGARGGVINLSKVLAECYVCHQNIEALYQHVKKVKGQWRCIACAQTNRFLSDDEWFYPEDLPEFVLELDKTTLGSKGRVGCATRVKVGCPDCGEERWASWDSINRSSPVCKGCHSAKRWQNDEYRTWYSDMMRQKWEEGTYAEREYHTPDSGVMSSLHKDVKKAMLEIGLGTFESERAVGKVRVDELDKERKLIIEVFGNYWHCNPAMYLFTDVVDYPDGTKKVIDIWERDRKRIDYLNSLGYSVFIVWERDFRRKSDECMKSLVQWTEKVSIPSEIVMSDKE